jgi:hypothetical protein
MNFRETGREIVDWIHLAQEEGSTKGKGFLEQLSDY